MDGAHKQNTTQRKKKNKSCMDFTKSKEGRFMAEIFKVVYKGKYEVEPDDQLGTIIIRNRKYYHSIYDVDDAYKCKSKIKPDGELKLSGPTVSSIKCPSGYLVIDVDLFCGAFKETIYVSWLPSYADEVCYYDVKRIKSRYDEDEEILIYFGMYYLATEALLEITLLPTDNSVIDCGGTISAYTSKNDDPKYSSLLFSDVKVQSGEPIPLSRSIVAVPLGFKLSVKFDLCNDNKSVKINDLLNFDAELDEKVEKTWSGTNCNICAKVIWNAKYHSRGDLNDLYDYTE